VVVAQLTCPWHGEAYTCWMPGSDTSNFAVPSVGLFLESGKNSKE